MESFNITATTVPSYVPIIPKQSEPVNGPEQLSLPLMDIVAVAAPSIPTTLKVVMADRQALPVVTAENIKINEPTGYAAYIFHKIDPATNCRRSYMIAYQPSFFNEHCLVRQWGRIGSQKHRTKHQEFETSEQALIALKKAIRRRFKRGYLLNPDK